MEKNNAFKRWKPWVLIILGIGQALISFTENNNESKIFGYLIPLLLISIAILELIKKKDFW